MSFAKKVVFSKLFLHLILFWELKITLYYEKTFNSYFEGIVGQYLTFKNDHSKLTSIPLRIKTKSLQFSRSLGHKKIYWSWFLLSRWWTKGSSPFMQTENQSADRGWLQNDLSHTRECPWALLSFMKSLTTTSLAFPPPQTSWTDPQYNPFSSLWVTPAAWMPIFFSPRPLPKKSPFFWERIQGLHLGPADVRKGRSH